VATFVDHVLSLLKAEGVQRPFVVPGGGGTIDLLDTSEYGRYFKE
jgi:hypothetical protein